MLHALGVSEDDRLLGMRLTKNVRNASAACIPCSETLILTFPCSYVRADKLREAPRFDENPEDTEDLEFMCSKKSYFGYIQRRSLSEALIEAGSRSKHIKMLQRQDVVEVLAHLSYLKSLDLEPLDRFYLATDLLELCRSTLETDHPTYATWKRVSRAWLI